MDQVMWTEATRRVEAFLKDILAWIHGNMIKQNADKAKVILFTSERNAGLVNDTSLWLLVTHALGLHHVSEIWTPGLIPG